MRAERQHNRRALREISLWLLSKLYLFIYLFVCLFIYFLKHRVLHRPQVLIDFFSDEV